MPSGPWSRLFRACALRFVAERDRWALWLPVLLALGVGLYFALPAEPPPWLGSPLLASVFAILMAAAWRRNRPVVVCLVAIAAVVAGFAVVQWAAVRAAGPVVVGDGGPRELEGRVMQVEATARGQRVVLDQLAWAGDEPPPRRVRFSINARAAPLLPGQRIAVRAVLHPPPEPALPGGFDFARQAWFEALGAVGFATGAVTVLEPPTPGLLAQLRFALGAWRRVLTDRVAAVIGGEAGAVAAALLTGERAAISQATWDAYRDSGLAHLLSISGLHMSMVAGLVFLVVRGALALIPPLALRYPIKKWTALAALAATFLYLLLAGAPVPTQRSFIMIAIVLLAVLIDRTALSMRTVAWAAVAVLLWQPQSLVGASFQMSFAAVVALIAAYEGLAPRLAVSRGEGGMVRRLALYGAGIAFTTIVAGAATAFYAAHHFSRFASWSVAANLAAVPVTGFVVMPFGMLGLLLVPLGLEAWPLRVAGWGVDAVNGIAAAVAGWPGAAVVVPAPPVAALVAFSLGGLWLCLWRGRWRFWGVPLMAAAVAATGLVRPPDVLIDARAALMAVRGADGGLLLSSRRGQGMVRAAWLERHGAGIPQRLFAEATAADGLACDSLGCIYRPAKGTVALVRQAEALAEDCGLAVAVISAVPVRGRCAAPVVVDRFSVWRHGAHALWLDAGRVRVETVRGWQGERPWRRRPHRRNAIGDRTAR